jgi:hypothetical protein
VPQSKESATTLLFKSDVSDPEPCLAALAHHIPGRNIRVFPDVGANGPPSLEEADMSVAETIRVEYKCTECTEADAKEFHDHIAKHLIRAGGA